MKSSRDLRQEQCIKAWLNAKGKGTLVCATGFGKTTCGTIIASNFVKKKPDFRILVVVPTTTLKEQWLQQLDSLGLSFNCDVQVINTVITQDWLCDLLIIDEIHRVAANTFKQVFEKVTYKFILGLTATFERLDGKHEIIEKYCPVCDTVPIVECITNGWVSPYKEYLVIVDIDTEEYDKLNTEFSEHYEFFGWNFNVAMNCIGPKGHIFKAKLRDTLCPKGTEQQRKDLFKSITYHAQRFSACMQGRKSFINNHPKKIEITRKIIEARPFSKIITFSNNVKMAESIGMGGKVYTGRISKKKGRTTIEEFNKETVGVLHTVRKADEGFDCKGLSVGIVLGTDSGETKARQRLGRVIRMEEGKQAEMFYIILNKTVELKWFTESHKNQPYITIDEQGLEDVLAGKDPKPYKKKVMDFTFRY